jgi:GT2 family glycosyltransferase
MDRHYTHVEHKDQFLRVWRVLQGAKTVISFIVLKLFRGGYLPTAKGVIISNCKMKLDYSILLVTYNRAHRIKAVLRALINQSWLPRRIIVVDNCSDDETRAIISQTHYEGLVYLNTGNNVGHGAGLAHGLKWYIDNEFREEFILFAEDDSESKADWAESMINKIRVSSYSFLVLDGLIHKLGKRVPPKFVGDEIVDVNFGLLDGAVMKTSLLKVVGLPVTDWFMMCDDMEYSTRIIAAGYKIGCIKNNFIEILHLGGGPEASTRTKMWRSYYQSRNHVHYVRRFFSIRQLIDFTLIELKRLYGALILERNVEKMKFRLLGILHGVKGVKGRNLNPRTLLFEK